MNCTKSKITNIPTRIPLVPISWTKNCNYDFALHYYKMFEVDWNRWIHWQMISLEETSAKDKPNFFSSTSFIMLCQKSSPYSICLFWCHESFSLRNKFSRFFVHFELRTATSSKLVNTCSSKMNTSNSWMVYKYHWWFMVKYMSTTEIKFQKKNIDTELGNINGIIYGLCHSSSISIYLTCTGFICI